MGTVNAGFGHHSSGWDDFRQTLVFEQPALVHRRARRILSIGASIALVSLAALFSVHAYVTSTVRNRVTLTLEQKLGRSASIGSVNVGLESVSLNDVTIDGLGSIKRVDVAYSLSSVFDDNVEISRVDAYGIDVVVTRDRDGALSVDDIADRFGGNDNNDNNDDNDSSASQADPVLALHHVNVRIVDEATATSLFLSAAQLVPNRSARALAVGGGSFSGESAHPRIKALLSTVDVRSIEGEVSYGDGIAEVDLSGGLAGGANQRWKVTGSVDVVERRAAIRFVATEVPLDVLVPAPFGREHLIEPADALVNADLDVAASLAELEISGAVSVAGLGIDDKRLASQPLRDVAFTARGTVRIDRASKSVRVDGGRIVSGDVEYGLSVDAQLPDSDRVDHPQASIVAALDLQSSSCKAILRSLPVGLVPDLQGFELEGSMAARVELAIDWAALERTHFSSTLLAKDTGIDNCRVVSAPERMSADRLRASFEHTVPAGKKSMTFTVGPESDNYVPLREVSGHLRRSLMTTEDSRFYRHNGFIAKEFRGALIKNLERGRFAYGASSITMQVVKNVMLARTKTVSRKLEELFLTWYIERELSKDRILEIYVNAIEFGPGIYGIKPAAQRYFGKHPRKLNPVESAFFSSILPAPVRRFKQYCRGWAGNWTNNKIDRILDIMLERNRLDEEQYLRAIETRLVFRGSRRDICRQYQQAIMADAGEEPVTETSEEKGTNL